MLKARLWHDPQDFDRIIADVCLGKVDTIRQLAQIPGDDGAREPLKRHPPADAAD
jgi:hypothetical protein